MKDLRTRARSLRNAPTPFEQLLWQRLRGSQLGYKFRRQHVLDRVIVDFFCPVKALIVEIDGDTHDAAADLRRDRFHWAAGYRTVRYSNVEVRENMEGVLHDLSAILASLPDRWPSDALPPTHPSGDKGTL